MFNDKNTNDNNDPKKVETGSTEPEKDDVVKSEANAEEDWSDSVNETDDNTTEKTDEENDKLKKGKTAFFKKRSFKYGSVATAFTAIFIVIVILVNVALTLLSSRFPLSADLTSTKAYDISSDTIKYIEKIHQPVTIKIFSSKSDAEGQSVLAAPLKIMEQYPKYNSNINIQFIDYDKNPTAVAAYSKETLSQYDVVVSSIGSDKKEHYKHISAADLLVTQTDSSTGSESVVGNKTEQQIDSALDYVTSTIHPTFLFTTGHGESDSSGYQTLLQNGNFATSTVDIVSGKIPESASALVIAKPTADFTNSEINKIDTFLKNGGKYGKNIFIYLDPSVGTLPKLDEYISEWGVKVGTGVIYDESQSFDNSIYCPISKTLDSDVVGSNVSTNLGTDVAVSLPLTPMFTSKDTRTVASVIETESTSKLLADLKKTPSGSDASGPFTTMTLSTISAANGSDSGVVKSNMVVSGSYDMLDSTLLNSSEKNNSNVLLAVANYVTQKKSAVNVDEKYDETTSLSLSTAQRNTIMAIFVIIIPLAILVFGIITWLRRRHL